MNNMGRIFLIPLLLIIALSCESKSTVPLPEELTENILDIPVGNVGLIILVDSLYCFKDHNNENTAHNRLDSILSELKNRDEIKSFVENKSIQFLKDNHYKFNLITTFDPRDFLNESKTMNQAQNFDFKTLKSKYNYDDLFFINVTTGLEEDLEQKNNVIAKTYINVHILDLNQMNVKYKESIGGSKYIDQKIDQLTPSYAHSMISNSVVETINIIDQKFKH